MILGEDIAALLGLVFALIAISLATITGNPIFDAAGSICIGALLLVVSVFLGMKVKRLLVGQSAEKEIRDEIFTLLDERPEVAEVLNVITYQLGEYIMVSIKAKMTDVQTDEELINNINTCEKALKSYNQAIKWVFFEPDSTV